jgi:site-specific recombinase XerD
MLLKAFWLALKDALAARKRNSEGDYSPDKNSERFPEWVSPIANSEAASPKISLTRLVEEWWVEAKATGRKASTHESYTNTVRLFVDYLGHDNAGRVTRDDVIGFKNHRLATVSARTGKAVSAKTVKDSDLSALKTIFGWAKINGKMADNPAEGITIKLGQPRKLRSKGFTDAEAESILNAALLVKQGKERSTTHAAKRWIPWLCAYTGARVGELAQLRKQDVRREGKHWVIRITPEAGTVKTNEARDVVLHAHLIKMGFIKFVEAAASGHLFLQSSESGDVLGPLQGLKNRLAEFVRGVVADPNVAPNHAWRHRFKTVGMEAGIEHRILDAIQGQRPRNVAESYGDVTIRAQAAAIAKLPYYRMS